MNRQDFTRNHAAVVIFIDLVLIPVFILLMFSALREIVRVDSSTTWPSVSGTVTVSHEVGAGEDARVVVMYRYYVDDKKFFSTRLSYGARTLPPELVDPTDRLARLLPGSSVTVYYDPDNPRISVLYPGNGFDPPWLYAERLGDLVLAGFLLVLLVWSLVTRIRTYRNYSP